MKKNNLLQGAIVALLVASPFSAYADSQYPATDFQPKIVYQDDSIKSSTSADVKKVESTSADDAQYPATNFQPKVLFSDENYKHDTAAPSISPTTISVGSSTSSSTSSSSVKEVVEKTEEGNNALFLLLLAVAAGFVIFKNKGSCSFLNKKGVANAANSVASSSVEGTETGVARYLKTHDVSGVSKYLARVGKPTNVARYIAKQNIAQKAAQNDTDRG